MSNTDMKMKSIERKMKDFNSSLTDFENQFVIIPYQPSGYIDYSNFGQVNNQLKIDQFETYKRLYTGNDAFIVTWKNSIDFDYSNQNTSDSTTKSINLKFQVGEAMLGWLEDSTSDNEISNDNSFSEYKSQKTITSYTFRINASKFELTENYTYYFYKVPEISNQILFKVVSLEKEYLGKELMCYVLRLESLQDTLANTGRAKQQNVMPNAPGQGYLQPKVVYKKDYQLEEEAVAGTDYVDLYDRYVIPDKIYIQNNPVKKVVLKLFGLATLCNFTMIGRRAYLGGKFTDYGSPRLIFPINFSTPTTETLYRTQQAETNFYWAVNMYPEINFSGEVFDRLKSFLDFNQFWSQQGLMRLDKDSTQATNPNNNGNYLYQIYGQQTSTGYQQWIFSFPERDIITSYTYGTASTYKVGGNKIVHNHMFDSYWVQKQISVLPLKSTNTLNFGWTIGSAYAASVARNVITAFSLLLIGIGATLYQKYTALKFQGIFGCIPASLCDFIIQEVNTTIATDNNLKLSYFMNSESTDNGDFATFFKVSTLNTSFQADLTDIIAKDNNSYTTDMIGQTTDSSGKEINGGNPLLMDGTYSLKEIEADNLGFIIDSFNLQAIFSGDFSVEFLDLNGEVIWSGVYQSQAKWTGSIRELNTWKDTSIFGRENKYNGKPLAWPKALQPLDPAQSPAIMNFDLGINEMYHRWSTQKFDADGIGSYNSVFGRSELQNFKWPVGFNNSNPTASYAGTMLTGNFTNSMGDINFSKTIANGFPTIQSFINFYNKLDITAKWDISGSNVPNSYPTDFENWKEISLKDYVWEIEDSTNTKWAEIGTINEKVELRLLWTNGPDYEYQIQFNGSSSWDKRTPYLFIPGVRNRLLWAPNANSPDNGCGYAYKNGKYYILTIQGWLEVPGGGQAYQQRLLSYKYTPNHKIMARLSIQNNVVIFQLKIIKNSFAVTADSNLPDSADPRGWAAGFVSSNLPIDLNPGLQKPNTFAGICWNFGVKITNIKIKSDFIIS